MELWEPEAVVAKKLGLSRDVLAAYRKTRLEKNDEWRMNRNQVEISTSAIDKISTALAAGPAVPAQPPPPPEPVELEVVRIYPNPRLLLARHLDAGGGLALVWVPKNKNFRPRMKIKARPPDNGCTTYRLEGRCPRFPGRW
jgi:hypothetical protein